jgi:predicted phage-related endonuclease
VEHDPDEMWLREQWQITKPEHGSVEWLRARKWRHGLPLISASNAAAVHGEHEFMSMAALAVELLDKNDPQPSEPNEAMRRGTMLEPLLLHWASNELGYPITEPSHMYGYGRLVATLDGMSKNDLVFECKTTTKYVRSLEQMPRYWYWQGVHQSLVTGQEKINWVVLDGSLTLSMFTQKVTKDEWAQHLEACDRFLAAIDMGMMPVDARPTADEYARLYTEVSPVPADLPQDASDRIEWLIACQATLKQAQEQVDQAKAELVALLGASEVGTINGQERVTWKQQTRTSFDAKRFEAEYPALFNQFQKTTTFRVLRTK